MAVAAAPVAAGDAQHRRAAGWRGDSIAAAHSIPAVRRTAYEGGGAPPFIGM